MIEIALMVLKKIDPRVWIGLLVGIVLLVAFGWLRAHYIAEGAAPAEKALVDYKAQVKAASDAVVAAAEKHNVEVKAAQDAHNIQVENDHAQAVTKITAERDDARSRVNTAGGLRIKGAICNFGAIGTQAGSPAGDYDAATGTVLLPQSLTDDLLDRASQADQLSEQVRALEEWITLNGFAPK